MRIKYGLSAMAFVAALALFGGLTSAEADKDHPAFARRVAGTYFVVERETGTREFLTISVDGNVFLNSSAEGDLQFGSSQGVWERSGRRAIAMKVANFDFDDHGIAVVDFVIEFDPAFMELVGRFSGALYPDGVDPLNPGNAAPLFAFEDDIAGRRMLAR
ncbi:MAG TPA: hypothetical protein VLK65_27215 [Vicinamibacteria bacterium]|nr:hypothetical protein [Vicinamibacteria bacterium]